MLASVSVPGFRGRQKFLAGKPVLLMSGPCIQVAEAGVARSLQPDREGWLDQYPRVSAAVCEVLAINGRVCERFRTHVSFLKVRWSGEYVNYLTGACLGPEQILERRSSVTAAAAAAVVDVY